MTDVLANSAGSRVIDVTSDAARARIKARYRAEGRFRAYGLVAVGFAALFLVFLLADIVIKALPAFTSYNLVLDVPVTAETIDPKGTRDPAEFGQAGDFTKAVRDALSLVVPSMSDRNSRRILYGAVSSGGSDELRRRVMADPTLIGKTVSVPVLVTDEADLYYKGLVTSKTTHSGVGIATPSATTGAVTIFSTSNAFAEDVQVLKQTLRRMGDEALRDAGRASLALKSVEADRRHAIEQAAAAKASGDAGRIATTEGQLAKIEADVATLGRRVAELTATGNGLIKRFEQTGALETLDTAMPSLLLRINGGIVRANSLGNDRIEGEVLVPLASTADAAAGTWSREILATPESNRKLQDKQVAVLEVLRDKGVVQSAFNTRFFSGGDSREPELAGILGALVGSALTMLVTLVICLPLGVGAAVYLEEFAPKNKMTEIIEVNINNLAAVPSIVFGLLGLAVFLNAFALPRSAPLVGGLVLALLVLPTIIIASRAALKAVPPSIREAALGIGASKQQAVFHHVLPLAMPGIMTGTIIGMAHALGETAPLLMIGMIAFIVDVPTSVVEAATVLPVQVFLWADLPEIAFQAKTAAAILVLLGFLFVMNGLAIVVRKRFERRW
ncbi:phosphate ABC transporter permease PstA [Prosthecodimorpha staleyi]|uniref:Phosphate transport system permease protein PstA n=1 Tax=Prosthecodimorpha staleyi TaxID=2840188 RepID=A0A947D6P7_9HYPH|nr:phosphate ABC transporter permease PstA [Prosthecodimorpha staleyi]